MQLCDKSMISETSEGAGNAETEANRYSSDLILPPFMLRPRLKGRPVTFKTVREVSEEFRSSLTATAIKFVSLTDMPCFLISFTTQGDRRFTRGQSIPANLWPHQELHQDTAAFTVLYGDKTEVGPQLVNAGLWFSHREASKCYVMEHSFKTSADSVHSLIWWKDASQLQAFK